MHMAHIAVSRIQNPVSTRAVQISHIHGTSVRYGESAIADNLRFTWLHVDMFTFCNQTAFVRIETLCFEQSCARHFNNCSASAYQTCFVAHIANSPALCNLEKRHVSNQPVEPWECWMEVYNAARMGALMALTLFFPILACHNYVWCLATGSDVGALLYVLQILKALSELVQRIIPDARYQNSTPLQLFSVQLCFLDTNCGPCVTSCFPIGHVLLLDCWTVGRTRSCLQRCLHWNAAYVTADFCQIVQIQAFHK